MAQQQERYTVTALSPQVRDSDRVNVYIDGKYDFSLDISQVVDLGIKAGQVLSKEELANLKQESEFGKVYARALEYVLMRPRSSSEVRDYLYRKTLARKYKNRKTGKLAEKPGVAKTVAERVFTKLQARGYIDDQKFANWWVENRHQIKGVSMRKLRSELAAKGITQTIIDSVIADSSRNDIDELAKVIAKKRRRYSDEQKFMQYLARQGFSFDDIKAALRREDC
jgi:hypothetical protein